jgi:prolyl-tRNA synthetase
LFQSFKSDEEFEKISMKVNEISTELRKHNITVKFDNRDTHKPGFKFAEWELKGVPVRLAIGPRDLENGTVEVARRDTKEKKVMQMDAVAVDVLVLLDDIQKNIHQRALKLRESMTTRVDNFADFKKVMEEKGGFILAHWDGTKETEAAIKDQTKATIRCIPLDAVEEAGVCVYSGKPSSKRVLFAQAY